ncbi:MAG: response regulator [candidate division NC10 bacterium]|nr:response regulator [candidate division NC10 bacterium]
MPRPKILIVDDERFFAELLTECLAELGPDLLYARDGASALRQAKEQGPDLILLDLVMPGRDGFEVAKTLKQQPETREIPIIFLTGVSRAEHRVEGLGGPRTTSRNRSTPPRWSRGCGRPCAPRPGARASAAGSRT